MCKKCNLQIFQHFSELISQKKTLTNCKNDFIYTVDFEARKIDFLKFWKELAGLMLLTKFLVAVW